MPRFSMFDEVEKRLHYRFFDKGRERSNHAKLLVEQSYGSKRRCPLRHDTLAYSGPPHDAIRCYVCLRCNAAASEPEIKDRGYEFDTVPDWDIHAILDDDLQRQAVGSPTSFGGLSGPFGPS